MIWLAYISFNIYSLKFLTWSLFSLSPSRLYLLLFPSLFLSTSRYSLFLTKKLLFCFSFLSCFLSPFYFSDYFKELSFKKFRQRRIRSVTVAKKAFSLHSVIFKAVTRSLPDFYHLNLFLYNRQCLGIIELLLRAPLHRIYCDNMNTKSECLADQFYSIFFIYLGTRLSFLRTKITK